jgi:hypothetical protein
MDKNSNQTGTMLLLAITIGAAVYALVFFSSQMEQSNMSASFGQLTKSRSINLLYDQKVASAAKLQIKEIRSEMSGISLPTHTMKSNSDGNYSKASNVDFPTEGIVKVTPDNYLNQIQYGVSLTTRSNSSENYTPNQSNSFTIGNSEVQYISNPQAPTKSDINAMFLLDSRTAESVLSSQQGSKRATPSLATKTASVSANMSKNTTAKKINGDGGAGDPGNSLPVGDVFWILFLYLTIYVFFKVRYLCLRINL